MATLLKDPNARLDYCFNWRLDYLQEGEVLTGASFSFAHGTSEDDSPPEITSSSFDANTATCWIIGGTDTYFYRLTCTVTTNFGRSDDRDVMILCTDQ